MLVNVKFYTKGEEIFNSVSHGVGSLLSVVGTSVLVTLAALRGSAFAAAAFAVYGFSLIVLYTMSTLYHAFPMPGVKRVFRIFDHSTIFLLIAGSYTPFTLVLLRGSGAALAVFIAVWAAALLGMVLNAIDLARFEKLSMVLYVVMGWAALSILPQITAALGSGLWLLVAGGVSYTVGLVFYAMRKVRYMHGVWHLFVLAGSILHFFCVLFYVLPCV